MFGTDFPIQSHKDSMEIVKSLRLPKREEERVFYGNAIELLGL
jgi:predicted TIM-barrel fold metal-dependent hydrolase